MSTDDSFNTSADLMDLSIKNIWVIVRFPHSDPDAEFEIVSKNNLMFDSWEVLERGTLVTVKYGKAKVQGVVITVSDDHQDLSENFDDYIQEYEEMKTEKKKKYYNNRPVIKVADKSTQTDDLEGHNVELETLKRQYEELENKYNGLKASVSEVKSEIQNSVSKLVILKCEDDNGDFKPILQPLQNGNLSSSSKENNKQMVQIGSGGTKIPRHIYNSVKWTSYSAATRKLLITLFPRSVLATHSLTGKPSPAFISSNKQTKMRLNPTIISDIIEVITRKCLVSESLVRNSITTKCADENKMFKKRQEKQQEEANEENNPKKLKTI